MRTPISMSLLVLTACHAADRPGPAGAPAPNRAAQEVTISPLPPGAGDLDRSTRGAVVAALAAAGYRERSGANARVDVGIAERPLRVTLDGDPPTARHALPSLCRRRGYMLSIAIIDRANGKVRARGSAAASRCRAPDAAFLARLAQAAVARF